MKICPKCKAQCADGTKFCVTCGTPLGADPVQPQPAWEPQEPGNKKKKKTGLIIGIVAAAIVVVVAVAAVLLLVLVRPDDDGGDDGWSDVSSGDEDREDRKEDRDSGEEDDTIDTADTADTDDAADAADTADTDDAEDTTSTADDTVDAVEETADVAMSATDLALSDYRTHSYELVEADMSWYAAFRDALDRGGHLLTIDSEDELQYVLDLIEGETDEHYLYYIGACRGSNDDQYYWLNSDGEFYGDALNSGNWLEDHWLEGEPSFSSDGQEERYVDLIYVGGQWVLNDISEDITSYYPGKVGYIIEWDD
jgi:hypothetical protein